MLREDHCLPVSTKVVSVVEYSLINDRNCIHVVSDVTLCVNMTPLTVEDRLLIKTSQTEKSWIVEKTSCSVSSETLEMAYDVCSLTNN